MKCYAGPTPDGGDAACRGCGEGYMWNGFTACEPCGPGWFSVGGEACKPCPIGFYSDKPSNTTCVNCTTNTGNLCTHPCSTNDKGEFDPKCPLGCFTNVPLLTKNGGFIGDNAAEYMKYIRAKDGKPETCEMRKTIDECNQQPYCRTDAPQWPNVGLSCCVPNTGESGSQLTNAINLCRDYGGNTKEKCESATTVGAGGISIPVKKAGDCKWIGEPCIWKSS